MNIKTPNLDFKTSQRFGRVLCRAGIIGLLIGGSFVTWAAAEKIQEKKEFYPNGQIKTLSSIDEHGRLHGIVKTFDQEGRLVTIIEFNRGERTGLYRRFHANGQVNVEAHYHNNKKEGLARTYDSHGRLFSEGHYHQDKPTGIHRLYTPEGLIKEELHYQNGKISQRKTFTPPKRPAVPVVNEKK